MKKLLLPALIALVAGAAAAAPTANLEAPPLYAGDSEAKSPSVAPPARKLEPKAAQADMSIAPTEADMARAREAREKGEAPRSTSTRQRTKIEAVRDPNNRVTEYVVTPGSTQIPYRIENQSERPIDTTPGRNPSGTLGNTKLIEIGW